MAEVYRCETNLEEGIKFVAQEYSKIELPDKDDWDELYHSIVAPAVNETIHGVYLVGANLISGPFGSLDAWSCLCFDIGDMGWLVCSNGIDGNVYEIWPEGPPSESSILACCGPQAEKITPPAQKKQRLDDIVAPMIGRTIESIETVETYNPSLDEWQDDFAMPIRIRCMDGILFTFEWWKADAIQVGELQDTAGNVVSRGDLMLSDIFNPLQNRWKQSPESLLKPAFGKTIEGARSSGKTLRFCLEEDWFLDLTSEPGKTMCDIYRNKPKKKRGF